MKTICVCVALACGVVLAGGASAAEKKVVVSYSDLDISKPAGQDVFKQRLALATRRICGPEPGMARRLREGPAYEACLKDATERAMAALPRNVAAKLGAASPINEAMLD